MTSAQKAGATPTSSTMIATTRRYGSGRSVQALSAMPVQVANQTNPIVQRSILLTNHALV
ncbi:hypothetical protein QCN29_35540 [Streptomyces sp. HNM0663]|uniref:Uncharacterized protein n=1 Tax=Streptomyces chengmaiensis TaxID=3040919 RepID=A0ABT6HZ23_9ACTN|nr:hypothetical protein [Streptomyces chengmaiensis]